MTEHATADTTPAGGTTPAATDLELTIGGMTCASCAARIEKKLNKLDGVTASVNYATEKAKVSYTGAIAPRTWSPWSRPPATPPRCRRRTRARARRRLG